MQWQQIVVFISLLSMAIGSFAAIGQTNLKRLMAYSSIGHMGFAMVGLVSGTQTGVYGVLIYMAIYLTMTLGTFAALLSMRIGDRYVENIADLAGLSRSRGTMAFFVVMMMFSLAGIPPLAGFFAKLYVFQPAIQAGFYWLAVIGVLLSVVSTFYYLRIVKVIYFDQPAEAFSPVHREVTGVLWVATMLVLLFWVWPAPVLDAAAVAAKSLF
jgi:NADH-quinone oxidoreductase subunit N